MQTPVFSPESLLQALTEGPIRISRATSGLSEEQLSHHPEPGEWSIAEILAHLRVSADVRGDQRIGEMLDQDEPAIRTVSPARASLKAPYLDLPFADSLAAFTVQRQRLLERLSALDLDGWQRGASLTGLGDRRRETVQSEATMLADHEGAHLVEIERCATLIRASS